MPAASLPRYWHYAHFARPSHERLLYRWLKKSRSSTIVELGVESAIRASRMIEVALRYHAGQSVHYTGIDLFEARGDCTAVTLKCAFRKLAAIGAKVRLVPADPVSGLARHANSLTGTDVLVVSLDQDPQALEQAWRYIPRMLHSKSLVFVPHQEPGGGSWRFRLLSQREIEAAACQSGGRRKLAAAA